MSSYSRLLWRGGRAALLFAVTLGVMSSSALAATTAMPPRAARCLALVQGIQVGPIPHSCGPTSQYTFARLDPFIRSSNAPVPVGTAPEAPPRSSAANFRGWARVADEAGCQYDIFSNPIVCAGAPVNPIVSDSVTAYRYTANGWQKSSLKRGSWVWAQHYSESWEWGYANGSWYAMSKRNLEAYCQRGAHQHSNCTLSFSYYY
jgi:hypothetical protein